MIVEDDAVFSAPGLQGRSTSSSWPQHGASRTSCFTDAALCDFNLMIHLASLRDRMIARGEFDCRSTLAGRSFFGATAYAVRGASKG